MNRIWAPLALTISLLLMSAPAMSATWQQLGGPEAGDISELLVDPSNDRTIYAGTFGGGVYKSTNGGDSWSAVNSGLAHTNVWALAISPSSNQTLYAGTCPGGLFKSTNGGDSWSAVSQVETCIESVAVDPSTSDNVYVIGSTGVFKSTNGGAAWSAVIVPYGARSLVVDPSSKETIYALAAQGVYKSTDGAANWSAANSGLTSGVIALLPDPTDSQILYAGTRHDGLFKSTNGGNSWSAVNSAPGSPAVALMAIDPVNSQTIYVGSYYGGVFKSTNGGASWSSMNSGLANNVRTLMIAPTSQSIYAGTYGGGVFRSTTGVDSWSPVNTGLASSTVSALAPDPGNPNVIYAGTDGGGIFKSINGGASWSAALTGMGSISVHSLVVDQTSSQTVYAGTVNGLFKSINGGLSWNALNDLSQREVFSVTVDWSNPQTVYAATDSGGYKSTNAGSTWSPMQNGLPTSWTLSVLIDPASSQTIYAGGSSGVFKSTNGGSSWSAVNSGLLQASIESMNIDPLNSQVIYAASYGAVYKTTNGGGAWSELASPDTGLRAVLADRGRSGTVYLGTDRGLFKSTDGGATWSVVTGGHTSGVYSIASDLVKAGTLYVGMFGSGVVKMLFTDISGAPASSTYSFIPTASNAAGFSITNKPSWANFDVSTGALTGIPARADAGSYDNIVITANLGTETASLPAFSITVTPPLLQLSVAFAGTGAGTINSSPGGIACSKGSSNGCSAQFAEGSSVALYAFPDANSTFGTWSGGCQAVDSCSFSMNSDQTVTATFTASPRVKMGAVEYNTLAAACTASWDGATILARELEFLENLVFAGGNVTIRGGYDAAFAANAGNYTAVKGSLRIRSGRLIIDHLSVR